MKIRLIESDKIEDIICDNVKENEVNHIIHSIVPIVIEFIQDLNDKLKEKKKGFNCVGLAAPQWGDFRKYFIRFYGDNKGLVFFNPWFVNNNSSRVKSKEGCFSYDLGNRMNVVKRYKSIIMFHDIWDKNNNRFIKRQKVKIRGEDAIILQHEIQHLYGKTIFN